MGSKKRENYRQQSKFPRDFYSLNSFNLQARRTNLRQIRLNSAVFTPLFLPFSPLKLRRFAPLNYLNNHSATALKWRVILFCARLSKMSREKRVA